ncbi:MAG TPA: sigma-54 dependent transcriptional regulator, partial [Candidatus Binataceae bacterium]|nr:sigma-54 dependent transcriptional regulator [Candidatus Binataceae bacterium]
MTSTHSDFSILVVDDDPDMVSLLSDVLGDAGYRVLRAGSGAAALQIAASEHPDLLISDLRMSGMTGHQLQARLKSVAPELPVVIITAFGSIQTAIESMRLGAFDYITKPFGNDELTLVVERALEDRRLRREVHRLRDELAERYGLETIITQSARMRAQLEVLRQMAESPASVLITGESGVGKDLFARALHYHSSRRGGPFVAINCAAIPDNLLESELFGFERGAFTDAREAKAGLIGSADHGTLFLDEISEMPPALQAKLLRVLEDHRVRPIGATRETPVDVRVVTATNANLDAEIASGRFRADLYYRIATVTIAIPPLRERPEDIALLARHFAARAAVESGRAGLAIGDDAMDLLMRHSWPGNVRELQNAVQHALVLCRGDRITRDDLPPRIAGGNPERINLEG